MYISRNTKMMLLRVPEYTAFKFYKFKNLTKQTKTIDYFVTCFVEDKALHQTVNNTIDTIFLLDSTSTSTMATTNNLLCRKRRSIYIKTCNKQLEEISKKIDK